MHKMLLLLTSIFLLFIPEISAQLKWNFLQDFPSPDDTLQTIGGIQSVAVDPEGKVWLAVSSTNGDSIYVPDSSRYFSVNAIYCFLPDGSPATFSDPGITYDEQSGKIFAVTVNGKLVPFYKQNFGIETDQAGNILLCNLNQLIRIDFQTGEGLNELNLSEITGSNSPLCKPSVASNGDIFLSFLYYYTPVIILDENFNLKDTAVDSVAGFGTTVEVSPDGLTLYVPRYTLEKVFIYHRQNMDMSFVLVDSLLGMSPQASKWGPDGNLWLNAGKVVEHGFDYNYTVDTYYSFDVNTMDVVDSMKWTQGEFHLTAEKMRGVDFWSDGIYDYSYLVCYGTVDQNPCQKLRLDTVSFTVDFPNGGEILTSGTIEFISWSGVTGEYLLVQYSTNNGTSWIDIRTAEAKWGWTDWGIPAISSDHCLVRLKDIEYPGVFDISDSVFTLRNAVLDITSPVGGEKWKYGSQQNITWISDNIDSVKLEYSTNNGNSWELIESSIPSSGSYLWTIPDLHSRETKIRITDLDEIRNYEENDEPFIIYSDLLYLTLPNGGELFYIDTGCAVHWYSYELDSINIYFSIDNGQHWDFIDRVDAAFPQWNFPLQPTPSTECLIRITDYIDTTIFDQSDSVFSIGKRIIVNIDSVSMIPEATLLYQNYPNPFNNQSTFSYDLQENGYVKITVYDVEGNVVAVPVEEYQMAGNYSIRFNAAGLSSGIYFYRLQAGTYTETKKMLLLK